MFTSGAVKVFYNNAKRSNTTHSKLDTCITTGKPLKMNRRIAKAKPNIRQRLHLFRLYKVHIYLTTESK